MEIQFSATTTTVHKVSCTFKVCAFSARQCIRTRDAAADRRTLLDEKNCSCCCHGIIPSCVCAFFWPDTKKIQILLGCPSCVRKSTSSRENSKQQGMFHSLKVGWYYTMGSITWGVWNIIQKRIFFHGRALVKRISLSCITTSTFLSRWLRLFFFLLVTSSISSNQQLSKA